MVAEARYTFADVRSRNGKGGEPVWMVYKDSVYDVTSYIPQHPAGDVMLEEAGADCTKAFDESGHSSDALTILSKYKIGEIVDELSKTMKHPRSFNEMVADWQSSYGVTDVKLCSSAEEKRYDANGKKIKKKKVVAAAPEASDRGCLRIITCGLVG